MNKNRFKQLLESTMGNVKPLVMEQVPSPEALGALKSSAESVFQFNKQYFEGAKTGVMILEPNKPVPSIQSINGIDTTSNYTFNDFWSPNGTEFGRGFRSGNGNYTYSFDGTNINLMAASDNTSGMCKTLGLCMYEPEQ
jgi:hypothetical protein